MAVLRVAAIGAPRGRSLNVRTDRSLDFAQLRDMPPRPGDDARDMTADPRDEFSSAARRAVEWLLSQQLDDGSLGPGREDLGHYCKPAQLLQITGHARATHRMLDHVAREFQQPDGRFANSSSEKSSARVFSEYEACLDGWLAIASHRAGRFELARPAWAHLRRFANPGYGGFCLDGHYRGDGHDIIEVLTTAQLGMTALFCGELPLALSAGHYLRRFWEQQPEPEHKLLLRMDDSGECIVDWHKRQAGVHVLDGREPNQGWHFLGYPIVFLCMLASSTGSSANLARAHVVTAKAFAQFAERHRDALLASPQSYAVAWGLGLLAKLSGESSYAEFAHAIGRSLVARQSAAGTWQDTSGDLERVDQTAETALCLFEMSAI